MLRRTSSDRHKNRAWLAITNNPLGKPVVSLAMLPDEKSELALGLTPEHDNRIELAIALPIFKCHL